MRNLKKFLALALAMVMAFSMILSANALDKYNQVKAWDDKAQVTKEFTEAVDVLSGMKVFQGDDRGFAPGAKITRAETAALIYRLATGDNSDARANLYANYGNFKDVNEGDWFAGYVGYCANAGYIKGHNGYFNPYGNVTGYEALAMILRAVGYDKNHEFEGATWQTNVSALGTRLGVLNDVKNTHYANTLHEPSTREVVASILFNAITKPKTVTWTPALGYETTESTGNSSDGYNGATLGKKIYGLDNVTGIIVGNQDTGESSTRINTAKDDMPSYVAYFHQEVNFNANNSTGGTGKNGIMSTTSTKTVDAKTGIDMFGHKVKAWYGTTAGLDGKTTYALYDKAEKTALVYATDSVLSVAGGGGNLGAKAVAAGFNVDLVNSKAVFNQSFGISGATAAATNDYAQSGAANIGALTPAATRAADDAVSDSSFGKNGSAGKSYGLYLLISNSSDKKVDMVVAVNAQVSRVVEVNNYASNPTVTVPNVGGAAATDFNKHAKAMIEQAALTATSTKTLGDPVVAIAISGTNTSDDAQKTEVANNASASYIAAVPGYNTKAGAYAISNTLDTARYFYRLSKPTQYVEGVVTGYKNDSAGSHAGSVTINGQTIQRSALADAIIGYDCTADATNRGIETGHNIADSVDLSPAGNLYGKYRAYLDSEGNYIYLEPVYETKFVYGTYIDYTTPYASSSYEYTLVGVDLNGEQVKEVVKTVDGLTISGIATPPYIDMPTMKIPYRDHLSGVGGVTAGDYEGFLLNDKGDLTRISNEVANTTAGNFPTISPEVKQVGSGTAGILSNAASWNFTTTDAKLGTKLASGSTYFTNDTKFIVVSGAGTDTQKVETFTGIDGLMDGATNVTINGAALTATWVHKNTAANEQMFYTESPLSYASVDGTNPSKIDTIILPKDAVTWTGRSNLYFIGNNTHDSLITQGTNTFYLYTMYEDGEQVQVWLTNKVGGSKATKDGQLKADSFYVLDDSGYKTPMGDTVYYAHDGGTDESVLTGAGVISTDRDSTKAIKEKLSGNRPDTLAANCFPVRYFDGTNKVTYNATTYAAQTATLDSVGGGAAAIFNVSGAKVVNLNQYNHSSATSCVWPGITDLTSLNDAASTATVYHNALPKVAVQTSPTDPLTITVIYVLYDQT